MSKNARKSHHLPLVDEVQPESKEDLGTLGSFAIEVGRNEDGGTLTLRPEAGQSLVIEVDGSRLRLLYEGPELQVQAKEADLKLEARTIELKAEDRVFVHGGKEVDLHSGVDLEVRADHHVNLWGHGVQVGD